MRTTCPACGSPVPVPFGTIGVGHALGLIGGLAVVAAFFMPWFEVQRLIMTGQFLNEFLAGTRDLRQFLPGFAGGPEQVTQLRALVLLFPACGAAAAILAALGAILPRGRRLADALLAVAGLVTLAALAAGLTQLPSGAVVHIGLWVIGAGAVASVAGAALDTALERASQQSHPLPQKPPVHGRRSPS